MDACGGEVQLRGDEPRIPPPSPPMMVAAVSPATKELDNSQPALPSTEGKHSSIWHPPLPSKTYRRLVWTCDNSQLVGMLTLRLTASGSTVLTLEMVAVWVKQFFRNMAEGRHDLTSVDSVVHHVF